MKYLADFFQFQGVTLGWAAPEDVEPLVAVVNRAYSYQDAAKGAPRINVDQLRERMAGSEFFVAKQAGSIVGCVYLQRDERSMHFGLLTVVEKFRGTGLAPALIEAIQQYAQGLGCALVQLDYMSVAPWLKRYYEKFGFEETGLVREWGTIDLVRMSKAIK